MVLAEELGHFVQARCILDLRPGSGHWALNSVRRRIPYIGICMTEVHRTLLQKKLISRCLTCMADPNEENLYDATFAKHLKALSEPAAGEEKDETKRGPKRGGNKNIDARPKPKNKKIEEGNDAGSASRADLLKMIQDVASETTGEGEGGGDASTAS